MHDIVPSAAKTVSLAELLSPEMLTNALVFADISSNRTFRLFDASKVAAGIEIAEIRAAQLPTSPRR
jgi:hypothetical protein